MRGSVDPGALTPCVRPIQYTTTTTITTIPFRQSGKERQFFPEKGEKSFLKERSPEWLTVGEKRKYLTGKGGEGGGSGTNIKGSSVCCTSRGPWK